jgi:hypothetical protein
MYSKLHLSPQQMREQKARLAHVTDNMTLTVNWLNIKAAIGTTYQLQCQ